MSGRLALLAAGTLVALALAEGALRLARPLWRIPYPPVCILWAYERHDPYGYRLRPGSVVADDFPYVHPRSVTLHANGDGFRGRELRADDPRPRIVVLGDSMVFGSGVDERDRFTERLEAAEPGWRVDNLGMVGFGPDLMLRALEEVGVRLRPAVVLMAVFSHDLYRVMPEACGVGFPVPRYALVDGRLVTVPYPERTIWGRLALVEGARYAYWRYTAASFPLNAAILDRYRALAASHGFTPALAFLPSRGERWDDGRRARWLRAYGEAHGMPFIDLTAPLREAGFDRVYIPDDPHWNAAGHQVAADALRPFLGALMRTRE